MDKAYIAIFSFTFLFLLHYILAGKKANGGNKGVQLPPSPPAIPFLGHLHHVAEKPLHAKLRRLAARYGPLFSLRLGARNAVVVSSAAIARECFTEHDVTFANRPQFPSQMLVSFGGTSLLFCRYGPRWRTLRRVATVHLLSAHRVACMSGVIAAEIRAMTRRICRAAAAGSGAARVQLKRRLFELSLSVLMETIANTKGTRPVTDADTDMSVEAQEFKKGTDEIIPYIGAANMWDFLPVMRWFDVLGVRNKILAVVARRDAFLRRLIDAERRRLDDGGGHGDKKSMIAVLLTLQKTEPDVYTDTMITALCSVSSFFFFELDQPCVHSTRNTKKEPTHAEEQTESLGTTAPEGTLNHRTCYCRTPPPEKPQGTKTAERHKPGEGGTSTLVVDRRSRPPQATGPKTPNTHGHSASPPQQPLFHTSPALSPSSACRNHRRSTPRPPPSPLATTAGRGKKKHRHVEAEHAVSTTPPPATMVEQRSLSKRAKRRRRAPRSRDRSCTSGGGNQRQAAAPHRRPPDPPQQGQSPPCHDEERTRGQKLQAQNANSAPASTPRAPTLPGSTDPREPNSSRPPTPPEASSGRGSSAGYLIPKQRHQPLLNGAARNLTPTIYRPETQERGSPTLPPPQRQAEREGTAALADGEAEESGRLSYRLGNTVERG